MIFTDFEQQLIKNILPQVTNFKEMSIVSDITTLFTQEEHDLTTNMRNYLYTRFTLLDETNQFTKEYYALYVKIFGPNTTIGDIV